MPVIVYSLARYLIILILQNAAVYIIEWIIAPLIDQAISAIKSVFGVDEGSATDILANEIISVAEYLGVSALVMQTKMPLVISRKLGFDQRGFVKRPLNSKLPEGVQGGSVKAIGSKVAPVAISAAEVDATITSALSLKAGFKTAYNFLFGLLGKTMLAFLVIGNFVDFGNWNSGAYQKTFQKIFAFVTGGLLVPDADYRKTKTTSPEVFDKVYNAYKLQGAIGISDPYKLQSVQFTRDNMIDLMDKVGAQLLVSKGSASTKEAIAATQLFIAFSDTAGSSLPDVSSGTTAASSTAAGTIAPITKVFTGIISQGVVGQGLIFTPRPDDLIESATELRDAAQNNLAPFLNTLLGKIVYEVKVVSSIITKEGFKQSGTTQQILVSRDAAGTPKYKTVTNKFAELVVYALTDKGSRVKLTTIVLGPTNSAKLMIAQNDLRTLETSLPALVTTTNINDIKGIQTSSPVTVSTPPSAAHGNNLATGTGNSGQPASTASPSQPTAVGGGSGATTLYDWYQSQGQSLPSVSARAKLYADFGLGAQSYYTGTAEQNTKLLAALKGSTGNPNGTYQLEKSNVAGGTELIYYPPGMPVNTSLKAAPAVAAPTSGGSAKPGTRVSTAGKRPGDVIGTNSRGGLRKATSDEIAQGFAII